MSNDLCRLREANDAGRALLNATRLVRSASSALTLGAAGEEILAEVAALDVAPEHEAVRCGVLHAVESSTRLAWALAARLGGVRA